MKPRDFLNFFKTGSGKLVLFAVVFGGGLLLFSVFRDRSGSGDDVRVTGLTTNATDRPQVVQSIERPMLPFHPPPPKPEPLPLPPKTNTLPAVVVEKPNQETPQQLAPISLFADSTAGVPEPKTLGEIYAPYPHCLARSAHA